MDRKLSSFIGLLLSDGSVYYDRSKRTYCIQFTNKLEPMRNYFKSLATKLFGIANFSLNKCKNALSVRFFSKGTAEFLFQFSPTYRTLQYPDGKYPDCKVPREIKFSETLSEEFLKAFASCDGSIHFNPKYSVRVVEIYCYHPRLLKDLTACLKTLGINFRICENSIKISDRPNLQKFSDSVNFLKESSISDRSSPNFGVSKTERLDDALK